MSIKKTTMKEGWTASASTYKKMLESYPEVDINYEEEKFVDYYLSTGGVSANWEATFRNWIRRSDEYRKRNVRESQGHSATSTNAISERRKRILDVAKSGDRGSNGKIKRLPRK